MAQIVVALVPKSVRALVNCLEACPEQPENPEERLLRAGLWLMRQLRSKAKIRVAILKDQSKLAYYSVEVLDDPFVDPQEVVERATSIEGLQALVERETTSVAGPCIVCRLDIDNDLFSAVQEYATACFCSLTDGINRLIQMGGVHPDLNGQKGWLEYQSAPNESWRKIST